MVDFGLKVTLKTSAPTEKTWSGYKAVWSDSDGYTFEETATEGLSYGIGFTPKLGGIYNENATIVVTKLFEAVKPITTNDTACLIYIDGTSLSNQALAPNKQVVEFDSGVTLDPNGYISMNGNRITTSATDDGFGGSPSVWTMDICFKRGSGTNCYITGYGGSDTWCLQSLYRGPVTFRHMSSNTIYPMTEETFDDFIAISVQYENQKIDVWNDGIYTGSFPFTMTYCTNRLGIGCCVDGSGFTEALKFFRFSNKARYTPGVDFELPVGFVE